MADWDLTALVTVLATTGVIGSIIAGFKGLGRQLTGREHREQVTVRSAKAERDREWRKRLVLGEAYAQMKILAVEAGADPAEVAMVDRLVDKLREEGGE
ncbi:hypothetical protein PV375_05645 [Gulosibacter sp. GYB002]|uniref:hypothetical protein n=1 Tax=Gulosibacter sp. GYB002 TaxID=2994391 RepID=UPI002F966070